MTHRSFVFVLIAASLLAVGSFAVACGGDDEPLSIQEYFARFDRLGEQLNVSLQEADAANDGEDALTVIQENLANSRALYASFADGVSDLEPPDEIKSQHEELVGAIRAFGEVLNEYSDEVSAVDSMEELQALATDEELNAAAVRSEQACLVLEQFAADNRVETDLNC